MPKLHFIWTLPGKENCLPWRYQCQKHRFHYQLGPMIDAVWNSHLSPPYCLLVWSQMLLRPPFQLSYCDEISEGAPLQLDRRKALAILHCFLSSPVVLCRIWSVCCSSCGCWCGGSGCCGSLCTVWSSCFKQPMILLASNLYPILGRGGAYVEICKCLDDLQAPWGLGTYFTLDNLCFRQGTVKQVKNIPESATNWFIYQLP